MTEIQNNKDPGRREEKGTMPSKDKVKAQSERNNGETRPFTVFYVNPATPEEVHTDTIMAINCEDASALAGERHRANTILHIRGIGDNTFTTDGDHEDKKEGACTSHLPCARFINGKFHPTIFSDDTLLESLFDQA